MRNQVQQPIQQKYVSKQVTQLPQKRSLSYEVVPQNNQQHTRQKEELTLADGLIMTPERIELQALVEKHTKARGTNNLFAEALAGVYLGTVGNQATLYTSVHH